MRICYLDESGVPELTAPDSNHFVLLGLSIRAENWKVKDAKIEAIKKKYDIAGLELHTGFIARPYPEQRQIRDFDKLDYTARRVEVDKARQAFLIKKATQKGVHSIRLEKKNLAKTLPYAHLSRNERNALLREVADLVGSWGDCAIFADCIDKRAFAGKAPSTPPFEEAFGQVVTRFHRFLEELDPKEHGILVQDQHDSMSRRLTDLMRMYHAGGTRWAWSIPRIIETPLFVNSELTSLIQAADLCAFAARRFCEKGETDLFERIYPRFHTAGNRVVGIRHYTGAGNICPCRICLDHRVLGEP